MAFSQLRLIAALASTLILLIATFLYNNLLRNKKLNRNRNRKLPEPGFAWPIIGHFHLFSGNNNRLPHKVLAELAKKHGPIFRLRLGAQPVLVVSNSKIAKQCFTGANDRALTGRPKAMASEYLGYNYANFVLAPPTRFWRDIRKFIVLELHSSYRIAALERARDSAVETLARDIVRSRARASLAEDRRSGEVEFLRLEMKEWLRVFFNDVMLRVLFGHGNEEVGSALRASSFRRSFELLGTSIVGDFLPWLRWLDIGGHEKALKEIAKEMDGVMEGWLQEHKMKRKMKTFENEDEEDFMNTLLSHFEGVKDFPNGFDSDTVVKATCATLLTAATDTPTSATIWALSLVLNHNDVLEKIRAELDHHVGKERHVKVSDLNNLTYLQAVVKETLRLYPPGPLLLPRESTEDCVVEGYHISKGTRLLVNVSKIHRDPGFWSDPDEFKPERFLNEYKDVDVRGNHFELLPFGSGRRMCPGVTLGLQNVQLGLAAIVQGFNVSKPSDEPIDMTEAFGISVTKATPLHVLLTPRLPSHLYS